MLQASGTVAAQDRCGGGEEVRRHHVQRAVAVLVQDRHVERRGAHAVGTGETEITGPQPPLNDSGGGGGKALSPAFRRFNDPSKASILPP